MAHRHTCDEGCRTLNRDGTIVCRVTGRTYGQYVTVDPWNRGEQVGLSHRATTRGGIDIDHHRSRTDAISVRTAPGGTIIRTSHPSRIAHRPARHRPASMVRIRTIVRTLLKGRSIGDIVIESIVGEVARIVEFVLRTTSTRQTPLVLGALYIMRAGVEYRLLRIPANATLRVELPRLSRLCEYGMKRSSVRVGQNLIERCSRKWNDPCDES